MLLKEWTKCIKNGQLFLFFIASRANSKNTEPFTLPYILVNPLNFTARISVTNLSRLLLIKFPMFSEAHSSMHYQEYTLGTMCSTPFCCRMHMHYHRTGMGVWSWSRSHCTISVTHRPVTWPVFQQILLMMVFNSQVSLTTKSKLLSLHSVVTVSI